MGCHGAVDVASKKNRIRINHEVELDAVVIRAQKQS